MNKLGEDLVTSATIGDLNNVQLLLNRGVDVNYQNVQHGYTALSRAVYNNKEEIVKLLLNQPGININTKDKYGSSIISTVFANVRNLNIIKLLLRAGIDVNSVDSRGDTILNNMVRSRNEDIIVSLVRHGVDLNGVDKQGNTTLMLAAIYNLKDTARLFTESGADISLKNKSGDTALSNSVDFHNKEITTIILEYYMNDYGMSLMYDQDEDIEIKRHLNRSDQRELYKAFVSSIRNYLTEYFISINFKSFLDSVQDIAIEIANVTLLGDKSHMSYLPEVINNLNQTYNLRL